MTDTRLNPNVVNPAEPESRNILKMSLGLTLVAFIAVLSAVLLSGASAEAASYATTMSGSAFSWTSTAGVWTCTTGPCAPTCPLNSYPGSQGIAGDVANVGGFSGTLTLSGAAPAAVALNTTCSGCTVDVSTSGSLTIGSASTIGTGSTLQVSSGSLQIDGATLTNNGAFIYGSTPVSFTLLNLAKFDNNGSFTIQNDQPISISGTSPSKIINRLTKTISKSAGVGTTVINPDLDNAGTVSSSTGIR